MRPRRKVGEVASFGEHDEGAVRTGDAGRLAALADGTWLTHRRVAGQGV